MGRRTDYELVPVPKMARHHRRAHAKRLLKDSGLKGEEKRQAVGGLAAQMASGFYVRPRANTSWWQRFRQRAWERKQIRISKRVARRIDEAHEAGLHDTDGG
jgi:hypothetical protein